LKLWVICFWKLFTEQKMGTLMKQRLNQQDKFVEDDDFDDEDDNDGALIFENSQYAINPKLFIT